MGGMRLLRKVAGEERVEVAAVVHMVVDHMVRAHQDLTEVAEVDTEEVVEVDEEEEVAVEIKPVLNAVSKVISLRRVRQLAEVVWAAEDHVEAAEAVEDASNVAKRVILVVSVLPREVLVDLALKVVAASNVDKKVIIQEIAATHSR